MLPSDHPYQVRLRLVGETKAFESPQHLLSAADLAATAWHNGGAGGATVGRDGLVSARTGQLLALALSPTIRPDPDPTPSPDADPNPNPDP